MLARILSGDAQASCGPHDYTPVGTGGRAIPSPRGLPPKYPCETRCFRACGEARMLGG